MSEFEMALVRVREAQERLRLAKEEARRLSPAAQARARERERKRQVTAERTAKFVVAVKPLVTPTFTQSDLAREAGVSRAYVGAAVTGLKPPSRRLIEAAARLGAPVEDLLT